MNLAKRDKNIIILEKEMNKVKKLLQEKKRDMRTIKEENTYLTDIKIPMVYDDNIIISQQKEALEKLSKYIMEMTNENEYSEDIIELSKLQQKQISKKLSRLFKPSNSSHK